MSTFEQTYAPLSLHLFRMGKLLLFRPLSQEPIRVLDPEPIPQCSKWWSLVWLLVPAFWLLVVLLVWA